MEEQLLDEGDWKKKKEYSGESIHLKSKKMGTEPQLFDTDLLTCSALSNLYPHSSKTVAFSTVDCIEVLPIVHWFSKEPMRGSREP